MLEMVRNAVCRVFVFDSICDFNDNNYRVPSHPSKSSNFFCHIQGFESTWKQGWCLNVLESQLLGPCNTVICGHSYHWIRYDTIRYIVCTEKLTV